MLSVLIALLAIGILGLGNVNLHSVTLSIPNESQSTLISTSNPYHF